MRKTVNIFKVLSDENRLKILFALNQKNLCNCELSIYLGVTEATVSSHLKQLRQADLIDYKKQGKWIEYSLKKTPDNRIWLKLLNEIQPSNLDIVTQKIEGLDRQIACKSNRLIKSKS